MRETREYKEYREPREGRESYSRKKWSGFDSYQGEIDYKDTRYLSRFISERGRILPRKITGLTPKQQRDVAKAIKQGRQIGILPYINYGDNF